MEDRAFTCGISVPFIFKKNIVIQTVHFRLKRYPLLMPFRLLSSAKLLNDYLLRKIYENCSFPRVAWRHFKMHFMKDAVDSENSERVMEMSTFGYLYRVIA